ncbi:unnamed protein product [Mortierella alpina]
MHPRIQPHHNVEQSLNSQQTDSPPSPIDPLPPELKRNQQPAMPQTPVMGKTTTFVASESPRSFRTGISQTTLFSATRRQFKSGGSKELGNSAEASSLGVWPDMTTSHRPDLQALSQRDNREDSSKEGTHIWPKSTRRIS